MAQVFIAESAWRTIVEEVSFFASDGMKESAIYPMFGLSRLSSCFKAPWDMLGIEDIDYFVVTHAHAPIRKFCRHTPVKAKFAFADDQEQQEFQEDISQWSNGIFAEHSMLEIGNVHSHPFATIWTRPSYGGDGDYTRIHQLWEHMLTRKVNTPLEIILCRTFHGKQLWNACCFAFDASQKVVSLGKAEIVSDEDFRVQRALGVPFIATPEGIEWQKKMHRELPELEAINACYFGWYSARIKLNEDARMFVHFPPQFPLVESLLVNMCSIKTRVWSEMQRLPLGSRFEEFSFCDAMKNFTKEAADEQ